EGCRQGTGCQAKAILRKLDRYLPQAIRMGQPLPGDSRGRPEPRAVLPIAQRRQQNWFDQIRMSFKVRS
ncbi:MAG: hypothetical protein LW834_18965, partial [Cyanobium sp. 49614_E6]|nr:hypothetical protein [Cyanobium sp. 49614_E6]